LIKQLVIIYGLIDHDDRQELIDGEVQRYRLI